MAKKPTQIVARSWERQPGEPSAAWGAFATYRDLGPHKRSLTVLAGILGKSVANYSAMSARLNWVERCQEYDAWMDRQTKRAEIDAVRAMKLRHAKLAMRLQGTAAIVLRKLRRIERGTDELANLKASDVRDFIDLGAKLERLSRDVPAEETAQQAADSRRSFVLVLQEPEEIEDDGDED